MRDPGKALGEHTDGGRVRLLCPRHFLRLKVFFPFRCGQVPRGTQTGARCEQNITFLNQHKSVGLRVVSDLTSCMVNLCMILTGRSNSLKHESIFLGFLHCEYLYVYMGVHN